MDAGASRSRRPNTVLFRKWVRNSAKNPWNTPSYRVSRTIFRMTLCRPQVAAGMVITGKQHSRYRRFSPISLTQYWLSTSRTLSHPEAFSAAKTPRPFSLEGNAINQPFTAPAVIPDTRYFWKKMNSRTMGREPATANAISPP